MARSSLALCVVLAMSGCGAVASRSSETTDDQLVRAVPREGDVLGAPSGVEVPAQQMASLLPPKAFGLGYFWIGYAATDTGVGALRDIGSGDGFSFGAGFKVSETSRSFLEVTVEKTLKHGVPDYILANAAGNPPGFAVSGFTPASGYHDRLMFGGRSSAAARARLEHQPRAYGSYGIAYNAFKCTSQTTAGLVEYNVNGIGFYLGFGVEFPFAKKTSMSFDVKYHNFEGTDTQGVTDDFGSVVFGVLYLSRF